MSTCLTTSTELLELIDEAMRLEVHMAASEKERPAGHIELYHDYPVVFLNKKTDFNDAVKILRARNIDVTVHNGIVSTAAAEWEHTTKTDHIYECALELICH